MKDKLSYFLRRPLQLPIAIITRLPYFRFVRGTGDHQNQITFEHWFKHRVLGLGNNRAAYWPVHSTSRVVDPGNVRIGIDVCPGLMPGCYIQALGGISIGDYTQVAPNVGIISSNHDPCDTRKQVHKAVTIGAYCWIGFGAKILPGTTLGDFTVVGAGAVVTKSFPEGYCIVAGMPARKIKDLDRTRCERFSVRQAFHGYMSAGEYERQFHHKG